MELPRQARTVALFVMLISCKEGSRRRSAEAVEPVVAVAADAAVPLRDLPPSSRASYVATPRETWPCAFEVAESQGISVRGRSVFVYGERTACRMPHSLIAQGIWGCPDHFIRTDTDRMVRKRTFHYDSEGRLVRFDGGNIQTRYRWDGERLASTTREQWSDAEFAIYGDLGAKIVAVDSAQKPLELLSFEGDRLVRVDEYVHGYVAATATVSWVGDRPMSVGVSVVGPVRGSVSRRFVYDCPTDK